MSLILNRWVLILQSRALCSFSTGPGLGGGSFLRVRYLRDCKLKSWQCRGPGLRVRNMTLNRRIS